MAKPNLAPGAPILFAYLPGWNGIWDQLGGYARHTTLEIGIGRFGENNGDTFLLRRPIQTSGGDSGGGHFDENGNLIGVLEGGQPEFDNWIDNAQGVLAIIGLLENSAQSQLVAWVSP